MQWLELTIQTTSRGISMLADRLTALGFDSFLTEDETEFRDFLEESRPYWNFVDEELLARMDGRSQIRLYIEKDAAAAERIARLREEMAVFGSSFPEAGLGSLEISVQTMDESDWENEWKQYYRPIEVGDRLLVVPRWLDPENPEGRLCVLLDPGMMFGTGDHASTRLCLEALEDFVQPGDRVLDLGSGSGILSIAALRLGAGDVLAVDIDAKGEDIARENAGYNGFEAPRFCAMTGNVLDLDLKPEYDLVLANIVADVILPLAPVLKRYLRPGGRFVCSGILHARVDEILSALKSVGIRNVEIREKDGWAMCRGVFEPGGRI